MAVHKMNGRAWSMPGGLALGLCVSLGLTLVITGVLAKLVDTEKLPWEKIGYGIMVMLFLSSILGTKTASAAIRHRRLLVSLLTGVLYWTSLLAITALFFGGQYHGLTATASMITGGWVVVCLLELKREAGKKSKISKRTRR